MKFKEHINEVHGRKIDFYSDYGYIGSGNAVKTDRAAIEAIDKLHSPSSTKERDVAYLVLAILDEAKMKDFYRQVKAMFDRKLKRE
jgi:hypothetical protein